MSVGETARRVPPARMVDGAALVGADKVADVFDGSVCAE
jgi:hypothetical protein